MTLNLILPGIHQEITVKVIDLPYIRGDDVFAPVIMWGDPKKYRFEMKIGKTIWRGIYKYLKELEDDPMNMMMGDSAFKIDEQLSFLKDRILTIRGVADTSRSFTTKDGKIEHPKVFEVEFQSDLEDAERTGKETYIEAVFKYVIDVQSSRECRLANTRAILNEVAKKENKEIEKREKKQEKEKKVVAEWAIKKKEADEKKASKIKKLGDCGWN
jgi:hypothetical protein